MGYKNLEDRRKWETVKRPSYKKQYIARHRANEVFKVAQPCSELECTEIGERHHPDYNQPEYIIWLCVSHHKQIHRKYPNKCMEENCERKHHSKGYCKLHYNRMMRKDEDYRLREILQMKGYRLRLK